MALSDAAPSAAAGNGRGNQDQTEQGTGGKGNKKALHELDTFGADFSTMQLMILHAALVQLP
jgi:hypothetical protein